MSELKKGLCEVAVLVFILAGCTHVQRVKAVEGGKDVPYDSLGTLQVSTKAKLSPEGMFWKGIEGLTLTFAKTPSSAELYKRTLRAKLARKAHREYGADDVIQVTFWPDPESGKFPDGLVYARGEMVRYKPFPAESQKK